MNIISLAIISIVTFRFSELQKFKKLTSRVPKIGIQEVKLFCEATVGKRAHQKRIEIIVIGLFFILFIGCKFRYVIKRKAIAQDIQYHIQRMRGDGLICFEPLYLRPAYAVVGV